MQKKSALTDNFPRQGPPPPARLPSCCAPCLPPQNANAPTVHGIFISSILSEIKYFGQGSLLVCNLIVQCTFHLQVICDVQYLFFYLGKVCLFACDVQVNLFQTHLFLHQLTHNMTKDCSVNYEFSTWKLQTHNMLCT